MYRNTQVRSLQGSRTASGLLPDFEETIRPNYVKRPSPVSPSSRLVESSKSSDEVGGMVRHPHFLSFEDYYYYHYYNNQFAFNNNNIPFDDVYMHKNFRKF